jgi:fumarate hydratase class II
LRTLAITLTRLANDIRLLASGPSTGINELILTAVQPGSSIMPGKVNPVMAEMLNMAMFHVMGCDTTIALAAQAGQLELNVMMPIIAHNLFESMQVLIGSIKAFTQRCIVGMKANRQRAESWLAHNAVVITALNPLIGYRAGAQLVQEALAKEMSIKELALLKAQSGELTNRETGMLVSPEEIHAALDDLRRHTQGGIIEFKASGS